MALLLLLLLLLLLSHFNRVQLCDHIDGSPPGSPAPGILQARTLEWVAISFSSAWKWKVKVKSLSRVRLPGTPWTTAHQAPPSMGFSRQEYWSGVPSPSPNGFLKSHQIWFFSFPPFYRPLDFFTQTTQWILFSALQSHTNYLRGRFGCYWSPSKKQQRENGRGKADPVGSSTASCTLSLRGSAPTHTLPCGHSLSEHGESSPDFKN